MLQAVPDVDDHARLHAGLSQAFHQVEGRLARTKALLRGGAPSPAALVGTYQAQARAIIQELLPLAGLPEYQACVRALHEVRQELPAGGVLRRNLDLFLDGRPGGGGVACNSSSEVLQPAAPHVDTATA